MRDSTETLLRLTVIVAGGFIASSGLVGITNALSKSSASTPAGSVQGTASGDIAMPSFNQTFGTDLSAGLSNGKQLRHGTGELLMGAGLISAGLLLRNRYAARG